MSLLRAIIIKSHFWLKQEPNDKKICENFSTIFFAFSGLLLTVLVSQPAYDYLSKLAGLGVGYVMVILAIVLLTLKAIFYIVVKVFEIVYEKKLDFPPRYKVVLSALTIPLVLVIHKMFVVPFIRKYVQKN